MTFNDHPLRLEIREILAWNNSSCRRTREKLRQAEIRAGFLQDTETFPGFRAPGARLIIPNNSDFTVN